MSQRDAEVLHAVLGPERGVASTAEGPEAIMDNTPIANEDIADQSHNVLQAVEDMPVFEGAQVGIRGVKDALRAVVGSRRYYAERQERIAESEELYRERRNRWLESRLNDDPERPLPKVKIANVWDSIGSAERDGIVTLMNRHFDVNSEADVKVGVCVIQHPLFIRPNEGGRPQTFIGWINISDRNKGYGPATYLAILKSLPVGGGLKTHGVPSPDAIRMWDKLVAKGIARRIEDPEAEYPSYETVF